MSNVVSVGVYMANIGYIGHNQPKLGLLGPIYTTRPYLFGSYLLLKPTRGSLGSNPGPTWSLSVYVANLGYIVQN